MVTPRDAMETVATAVADSGKLPSDMSLLLEEADTESSDADVELPLLEVRPVEIDHVHVRNTDLVGYTTDANGNRTGRIYHAEYEMRISLDIWTTPRDNYDPDDLGENLRAALYPYASHGPQEPFVDGNGDPITEITYFRLDSGQRNDDLIQTPSVRRWSQEVELWASEEFQTDEDYIATVDYPSADSLNDTDGDGTVDSK